MLKERSTKKAVALTPEPAGQGPQVDRWLALRVWPTLSSVEYTEDHNRGCLDVVDDEVRGSDDDELARTGSLV